MTNVEGNYIRLGLEFLLNKIQQQQQQSLTATMVQPVTANSSDEAPVSEDEDDFFTLMSQDTSSATTDNILSMYTGNTSTSLDDLHDYPLLKNIFLELNTALPASAACECLFSVA